MRDGVRAERGRGRESGHREGGVRAERGRSQGMVRWSQRRTESRQFSCNVRFSNFQRFDEDYKYHILSFVQLFSQ